MTTNYYSTTSSNGAPVFAVPVQTTANQVPVLPPSYSMTVSPQSAGGCDCSFNRNSAIWLSSMLIIAGVMGIVGTAIGLYSFASFAEVGTGIWCGLMFLATGCVGLAAGHYRTIKLMKATVATVAFSVVFTVPLLTISIIGLSSGGNCWQFCYYPYYYCSCYSWDNLAAAANIVLISAASVALFFSFWLLVIASIRLRSMSKNSPVSNRIIVTSPQLHQVVGSNPQPQPIVIFSNHNQPTVLLGQQMPPHGGVTPLTQAQSFVIMSQQPAVMHGTQPIVLFGQEAPPPPPQGGAAAVNVQHPGAVYESIGVQNHPAAPMNGEPGRRGNKNEDGDDAGVNM